MSNSSGGGSFFTRKLQESEQIIPAASTNQEMDQFDSDWDGLWGNNAYNVDEHGRKKKNRKSKIPIYPVGPMFGSRPIDDEEEEELANANFNSNNNNGINNNIQNSIQQSSSSSFSDNHEFVHNSSSNPNPSIPHSSNFKPIARVELKQPTKLGNIAGASNAIRMANLTENTSFISGDHFHWSESSNASHSPQTLRSNSLSFRSNVNTNQNQRNIRETPSSSSNPLVVHSQRSTLSRPLPHLMSTNSGGKMKNGRIGQDFQLSDSNDSDDEDSQTFFSGQRPTKLAQTIPSTQNPILGNVVQNFGNSPTPNADHGNVNILNGPTNPQSNSKNALPNQQKTQNVQRGNSLCSLETAISNDTNSSFTIVSDPYVGQYVQQHGGEGGGENQNRRNIFEEIGYDDEVTGLEDLEENVFPLRSSSSSSSSSQTSTLTGIDQQCCSPRQQIPPFSNSNASIQTGSTLRQQIQLPNRLLLNPLLLANERQAFQELAQKLGLHFEVRQDEGAIAFSQPANHRILVLNSVMYAGETGEKFEGIRVSLHANGRIYRETHLTLVEKWLGHAAVEGLCRRFFTNGHV